MAEIYDWFTVGLPRSTTMLLREYIKQHPEFTEASGGVAIRELVSEALRGDAIQRNIELVQLLKDMEKLHARDKEGVAGWQQRKIDLIGE